MSCCAELVRSMPLQVCKDYACLSQDGMHRYTIQFAHALQIFLVRLVTLCKPSFMLSESHLHYDIVEADCVQIYFVRFDIVVADRALFTLCNQFLTVLILAADHMKSSSYQTPTFYPFSTIHPAVAGIHYLDTLIAKRLILRTMSNSGYRERITYLTKQHAKLQKERRRFRDTMRQGRRDLFRPFAARSTNEYRRYIMVMKSPKSRRPKQAQRRPKTSGCKRPKHGKPSYYKRFISLSTSSAGQSCLWYFLRLGFETLAPRLRKAWEG